MSEAVVAFRKVLRATLEGRLLFLNNDYNGLNGNNNLDNNGRFVGIVKLNWLRLLNIVKFISLNLSEFFGVLLDLLFLLIISLPGLQGNSLPHVFLF